MPRNRYLMDKAMRDRTDRRYNMRISGSRDSHYNSGRSYGNNYDNSYDRNYDRNYDRDYNYDERDYNHQEEFHGGRLDYSSMESKYKEDLHRWSEKLKRKSGFAYPKEQVIEMAKQSGVKFQEYDELEFYVTYLAMTTDYHNLGGDAKFFVKMAKDFLEDDDVEVSPSEKLCIYYYKIVKGEE